MQYAPGCIIQCAMVGSKWRCSYLFSIKTAIVDNSIHLPTMDEEEHVFNLACFQHWFSFLQAEIQNLEYWLPSVNTFTSQHALSPYIAPSTGFGHLYLQFWLACPHNGAEVYLCNPCSSKKETRVRGCSSTLRLRSCVCLPSIQFWLSVHFFALLLSYLLGALVLQRFNLISTNPLNSPKYMYVNPLPHNGFWMCLVYLILRRFKVGHVIFALNDFLCGSIWNNLLSKKRANLLLHQCIE
jgi:hypothetical protein